MATTDFTAISYRNYRAGSGYSNWRTGYQSTDTNSLQYPYHPYKTYIFFDTAAIIATLTGKAIDSVAITFTPGYYPSEERMDSWVHMWRMANCTVMPSDADGNNMAAGIGTIIGSNSFFVEQLTPFILWKNSTTGGVIATGEVAQRVVESLLAGNALGMFFRGQDEGSVLSKPDGWNRNGGNVAPWITVEYHDGTSACTAPTEAALSAALSEGDVNLIFSGAAGGTGNAIIGYEIQYSESSDNGISWGAWSALKTISTSAGSGNPAVAVSVNRGSLRKYQIRTLGTAGANWYSEWKAVTGTARRNRLPGALTVTAPAAGATIYNAKPYVISNVGAEPDSQAQTVQVSIDGGVFATLGSLAAAGGPVKAALATALSAGSHTIATRVVDAMGVAGPEVTRTIMVASAAWTRAISTGTVIANASISHRTEIAQMRDRVNGVRAYYGLGVIALPGTVGTFKDWLSQMQALQAGIGACYTLTGRAAPAWIAPAKNYPRADVINQIRAAVEAA